MTAVRIRRRVHDWRPSDDQMQKWPAVSGNTINGRGETVVRRPSPIYWQPPGSTPHSHLQLWFYARPMSEEMIEARKDRQRAMEAPLAPLAPEQPAWSPAQLSAEVKAAALQCGADLVGITRVRPEWVFEGQEVRQSWVIALGVGQKYDAIRTAPEITAGAEVIRQYARGTRAARGLASWLREHGHDALPLFGPLSGPMVMIPPAIEAGLGELGKHGSMINRQFGANFRLAMVLTDAPLITDRKDVFGADDFCHQCRLCVDECPPNAIHPEKQWVRGEQRWYVDFDKCLPYFNEHHGCAICMAVCPWSRPGVPDTLLVKLAAKRQNQ
jgi:NAD-dependent dihydropyrimidine dehydrogenase PreA subunit